MAPAQPELKKVSCSFFYNLLDHSSQAIHLAARPAASHLSAGDRARTREFASLHALGSNKLAAGRRVAAQKPWANLD